MAHRAPTLKSIVQNKEKCPGIYKVVISVEDQVAQQARELVPICDFPDNWHINTDFWLWCPNDGRYLEPFEQAIIEPLNRILQRDCMEIDTKSEII